MRPLDLKEHVLSWHKLDCRTAVITIDIEPDFGGTYYEALSRVPELLRLMAHLKVPLTAFVEGKVFQRHPATVEALLKAGVDVQLHCYDHPRGGDNAADLKLGVAAYRDVVGRRPEGYRAHTYRLTELLCKSLGDEGFVWDSSILCAFAFGGNRSAKRSGDFCMLRGDICEFPVATWGRLPLPITQSYRKVIKSAAETVLRKLYSLPRLLVYDMHMIDLV